jgi:hypothetical protein
MKFAFLVSLFISSIAFAEARDPSRYPFEFTFWTSRLTPTEAQDMEISRMVTHGGVLCLIRERKTEFRMKSSEALHG